MWQLSHFKNSGLYVQKMIHSMISSLQRHINLVHQRQKHPINNHWAYQSFLKSTGQLFSIKRWSIWRNLGLKLFLKTFLMAFLNHFVLNTLCSKIKQLRSVLNHITAICPITHTLPKWRCGTYREALYFSWTMRWFVDFINRIRTFWK